MAQIVKLRRSSVIGKKPTNAQLELGELSINTSDGKVFFTKSGSLGPSVEELVSTNTVNTGSIQLTDNVTASFFTGSFVGDGSGLTGVAGSTTYGAVGTYVVALYYGISSYNTSVPVGTTTAGSNLYYFGGNSSYNTSMNTYAASSGWTPGTYPTTSLSLSGTWRLMTNIYGNPWSSGYSYLGLFVRIS